MKRAKTVTGLLFQNFQLRWQALGNRGKSLAIVGLVLAGAVALHLGTCLLGGCPSSASPCSRARTEPCSLAAPAAVSAESAHADGVAAAETAERPPCHSR